MSKIPRIIHQIWISSPCIKSVRIPPIIQLYMDTFKSNKDFEYKLWTNEDLNKDNFPITFKYIKKLLSKKKIIFAMIADLMRLEILYHHGGIYIDVTMECVKPLNFILKYKNPFIMSNEKSCGLRCRGKDGMLYISNSFIASVPKYKVLERLLSYEYLESIDFKLSANIATGPYYIRRGIKRHSDVKLLPTKYIYPFQSDEEDPCVSLTPKKGYKKIKYNNEKKYYIKFPCNVYNVYKNDKVYIVKHWSIGGTWIKK